MNTNKIALVTGGSRGLGKDMALRLGEKGFGVILTYNAQKDDAAAVVASIEQAGGTADGAAAGNRCYFIKISCGRRILDLDLVGICRPRFAFVGGGWCPDAAGKLKTELPQRITTDYSDLHRFF